MRLALVTLAVLAVVLPTAFIPETSSAHESTYSVRQVLRAFRAGGIALHPDPENGGSVTEQVLTGGAAEHLRISVYVQPPGASDALYVTAGNQLPVVSQRGNVVVFWTARKRATEDDRALVPAALRHLR